VQVTKIAYAFARMLRLELPLLEGIYTILYDDIPPRRLLPTFLSGHL
jgi:glycerol-3-phosphate dehydrogenase